MSNNHQPGTQQPPKAPHLKAVDTVPEPKLNFPQGIKTTQQLIRENRLQEAIDRLQTALGNEVSDRRAWQDAAQDFVTALNESYDKIWEYERQLGRTPDRSCLPDAYFQVLQQRVQQGQVAPDVLGGPREQNAPEQPPTEEPLTEESRR